MNSTLKWIATSPNCSKVWSGFQQSKSEGQQNQLSQFPLSQSSFSKGPYRMTNPTKYDSSRPEGCLFYHFTRSFVTKDMSDMWIAKFGWNNASSSSIQSGELPIGASPKKMSTHLLPCCHFSGLVPVWWSDPIRHHFPSISASQEGFWPGAGKELGNPPRKHLQDKKYQKLPKLNKKMKKWSRNVTGMMMI